MLIFVIITILIKRAGNSNNFKVKKETFITAKSEKCSRVKKKTIMIEEVRRGIFLPPLTSHDIWAEAPSGYGPSCEVASRPASFTMTGGSGGTEKR